MQQPGKLTVRPNRIWGSIQQITLGQSISAQQNPAKHLHIIGKERPILPLQGVLVSSFIGKLAKEQLWRGEEVSWMGTDRVRVEEVISPNQ